MDLYPMFKTVWFLRLFFLSTLIASIVGLKFVQH